MLIQVPDEPLIRSAQRRVKGDVTGEIRLPGLPMNKPCRGEVTICHSSVTVFFVNSSYD